MRNARYAIILLPDRAGRPFAAGAVLWTPTSMLFSFTEEAEDRAAPVSFQRRRAELERLVHQTYAIHLQVPGAAGAFLDRVVTAHPLLAGPTPIEIGPEESLRSALESLLVLTVAFWGEPVTPAHDQG